jgi:hypothetical protein
MGFMKISGPFREEGGWGGWLGVKKEDDEEEL